MNRKIACLAAVLCALAAAVQAQEAPALVQLAAQASLLGTPPAPMPQEAGKPAQEVSGDPFPWSEEEAEKLFESKDAVKPDSRTLPGEWVLVGQTGNVKYSPKLYFPNGPKDIEFKRHFAKSMSLKHTKSPLHPNGAFKMTIPFDDPDGDITIAYEPPDWSSDPKAVVLKYTLVKTVSYRVGGIDLDGEARRYYDREDTIETSTKRSPYQLNCRLVNGLLLCREKHGKKEVGYSAYKNGLLK